MRSIVAKSLLILALCSTGLSCSKEKIKTKNTKVYVEEVKVLPAEVTLVVGGESKLTAKVSPGDATNKKVNWTSSKTSVATVDANGKVTAVAIGNATITATSAMVEGKSGSCAVSVIATPIPTTGVTIDQTGLQKVKVGGKLQLTASLQPSNTTYHGVTWSSSNKSIATVSETGKVTGVARGTATITVTTENGNHTASIKVQVVQSFTSISITSPTTSDSHYNPSEERFEYMEGESFQIQASTVPAEAEDSLVYWVSGYASPEYIEVSPEGLVNCKKSSTTSHTVYVQSAADEAVYGRIKVLIYPKPSGISLSVEEIPDAEVVYKKRARDSWDIGVGATHKYKVSVEPSSAPQTVSIRQQQPYNGKATFSIADGILTVTVPATATPATASSGLKESFVTLAAEGGYTQQFTFYTVKLDPYKAKEGDYLAKDHLDKVGIEDGGYRGNGVYDTKGASVSVDFIIGSNAENNRNSLIMYVGSEHTADDPLWSEYGPKKSITAANGKAIHGIAVPKNANKVYRTNYTNGEVWENDKVYILDSSNLPKWARDNSSKNILLGYNTSSLKHSALFNTCAHVGKNAPNGYSYEVLPANFFVNDATKAPTVKEGTNCSDGNYKELSSFNGRLPSVGSNSAMTDYQTVWLFPTLADMCCIFGGRTFTASTYSSLGIDTEAKYRLALLKRRTGISDWNIIYWWVSQESSETKAVQFKVADGSSSILAFADTDKSGRAFVFPIIYF